MRISPLGGRRPTRAELGNFVNGTLDDIDCPDPWLLIVGINPGLWSAAVNAPFAAPSNRFWPSLYHAGLTSRLVNATAGLLPEDEADLISRRIGLTNFVNRATAKASELTKAELETGSKRIVSLVKSGAPASLLSLESPPTVTPSRNPKRAWGCNEIRLRDCWAARNCGCYRNRAGSTRTQPCPCWWTGGNGSKSGGNKSNFSCFSTLVPYR